VCRRDVEDFFLCVVIGIGIGIVAFLWVMVAFSFMQ
jgi:hypothetical protein